MRLVDNKTPRAAIVHAQTDAFAAAEFQRYLEKSTGAQLPIVTDAPEHGAVVSIGHTGLTSRAGIASNALPDQAFAIKADDRLLAICGADKCATLHGVYWFLEHELGCGWCMPGELGEVVPESATVEIGRLDHCRRPSLGVRSLCTFPAPGRPASDAQAMVDWSAKLGFNVAKIPRVSTFEEHRDLLVREAKEKRGMQLSVGVHTFEDFMPDDPYFKEHPEYFALVNGRRGGEGKHRICPSSMEAAEVFAKNVNAYLDKRPEIDVIGLGAKDGSGGWCECADCREKTGLRFCPVQFKVHKARVVTDAYIPFFNKVAEHVAAEHPDVQLGALFYTSTLEPPASAEAKLHPNIDAVVALFSRYYDRPLNQPLSVPEDYERLNPDRPDEATYTYYPSMLRRWREVTQGRVYFHAYFSGHGATSGLIFPIHDVIAADLEFYHDIGLDGFYTQANYVNAAPYGFNYYMAAHKAMDVETDAERILRAYMAKFYATAAEPMIAYFQCLGRARANGSLLADPVKVAGLFDRDTLSEAKALLDRAQEQCTDAAAQRRIAVQQDVLQYLCLYRDWVLACFHVRQLLANDADRETTDAALDAADRKRAALRDFMGEHMDDPPVVPFTDMDQVDKRLQGVQRVVMSMKLAHQPAGFDEPWDTE